MESNINNKKLVVIRGAGDIATGIAVRLHNCGFKVLMTEIERPTMIRCTVSFGQCLFDDVIEVEGITAQKAADIGSAVTIMNKGKIPVLVDKDTSMAMQLKPRFLVDAILAKENEGLVIDMAPVTIALGPGFNAGTDCDAVIETCRGHNLGRVIYQGVTKENTGIPGNIAGYTYQRVMRAPCDGIMRGIVKLGDIVKEGDIVATIGDTPVHSPLSGMVRGLLNNDLHVTEGFKIGDIDPRGHEADYTTVSDKARAIGGSVLEAMLHLALELE